MARLFDAKQNLIVFSQKFKRCKVLLPHKTHAPNLTGSVNEQKVKIVEPTGFSERQNGTIEVTVHQIVKDLRGNLMLYGTVKHIYTIQDNLSRRMDIELV